MKRSHSLWIAVTLAFVLLLVAWGSLIKIATNNRPEAIPVKTQNH